MSRAQGRPAAACRLTAGDSRPAVLSLQRVALGVLAGNLLVQQLPGIPDGAWLLVLAIAGLAGLRRWPAAASLLWSFCWAAQTAGQALDSRWPEAEDGTDVALVGWIDATPRVESERTVFSMRVADAESPHPPRRVRLSWYAPVPSLEAGQGLQIVARLRAPRGLVNPGTFDYERWLLLEAYDATGYVRQGHAVAGRGHGLARNWLKFRAALAARLDQLIESPDALALVQALALGERTGFEDRHWTVLQRTGTSHLVAVSGLHIGLIAALFHWLVLHLALAAPLAIARRAHWCAAAVSLVAASVYSALAGFTLPTRRALLMLLVVEVLLVLRRRGATGSGLAVALVAILLLDPLATLTASFWLSFGAVGLLIMASLPVATLPQRASQRRLSGLLAFLRLQLILSVGLAPLVLWYFGQVSVASLIVNLVAIPVFSIALVPMSLITAVAALSPFGDLGIASLTGTVADFVWRSMELAAGLEYAAFSLRVPELSVLVLAMLGIVLGFSRHRLPGRRLALLALAPLLLRQASRPDEGYATATVFDVGHGLAVGIETASHRVLYDTGPRSRAGFDAGAELVVPSLQARDIRPVDLVIVSHGDSDHAGGAQAVREQYPAARFLGSASVDQVGVEPCRAGQEFTLDGVRFSVLHPEDNSGLSDNDGSCVVLVETLAGRLLLTGDVEERAERQLVRRNSIAAEVAIVPHHGSRTSSTRSFVASVSPDLAIVSAAHNNRWNFPLPEISRRWQAAGATVLSTGDYGAIELRFDADGIAVEPLRLAEPRYWRAKAAPLSGAAAASAL